MENRFELSLDLLQKLIALPSFSREESRTARLIEDFLNARGVPHFRKGNNVWAFNAYFSPEKPTILLNSHHDTVKPNPGYTRDPFAADISDGKLYGLGSNDAGGSLVALLAAFLHFYPMQGLAYNLCFAASAEEEISGANGIESILNDLGPLAFAIVGEPTQMQMAVSERGLLVLDCTIYGKAGHAARNEGENAIYKALTAIEWFRTYKFPRVSFLLGDISMNVTMINAGSQHNVVPAACSFVVDIRVTDAYTHEEVLKIVRENVDGDVNPRSMRLRPSHIALDHPLVQAGIRLGKSTYGSPTLSDQALLNIPSLKMGPGDSARSHSADEFIFVHEIEEAISDYTTVLAEILCA